MIQRSPLLPEPVDIPKIFNEATGKQPLQAHMHRPSGQCGSLCKFRDGRALPELVPQGVKEVVLQRAVRDRLVLRYLLCSLTPSLSSKFVPSSVNGSLVSDGPVTLARLAHRRGLFHAREP